MNRYVLPTATALVLIGLAACGGRAGIGGAPNGGTTMLPALGPDLVVEAAMPRDTIGVEYYKEGTGALKSTKWSAMLTSYTQQTHAQQLGFSPGTKITIKNISKTHTHTLNVVRVIKGPPAFFPKKVTLSKEARGDGKLEEGYASGSIKPGGSVTVTLVKPGIYLIGCAFHYSIGMHDVLVVRMNARPGPQATATPSGGGGGGSGSGSGW
jgi:plastocyanin